jgi:hypothetical protein
MRFLFTTTSGKQRRSPSTVIWAGEIEQMTGLQAIQPGRYDFDVRRVHVSRA